ncbi:MAG: arylsulfatase [Planctomycetota bacterium]|nr:arylsulfatase [Planctomycetota bacterium]MDA1252366.1 arylsulfatase [Planctomycetota bacterium]
MFPFFAAFRSSFRILAIVFPAVAVLSLQISCAVAVAADRPNIIVVLADDMGYSDIGCYGGEINTPNLNGLAEGGLRFTQFYNTGRCCPTRACLLSGLYPHQAGIGWMTTDRGHDGYRGDLNNSSRTIAEVLRPAGYSTYGVGKWHVTKHVQPDGPKHNWPLQRGFEKFYGTITGAGSFYDPGTLTRGNQNISPFADPEYQPEQYYYTDAISDHAVRFIDEHCAGNSDSDKPFFLYVAYTAAHWPMHALEKDIAKYKGKYDGGYSPTHAARAKRVVELGLIDESIDEAPLIGKWDQVEHKAWESRCMEVYAAMVDNMDQGIGRIVGSLKKHDQFDNTLILFMQDNGGCQEGNGRQGDFKRPVEASLPKIAADTIRLDVVPKQNRAGVPTLTGPGVMPGPEDTYIAYGLNWANVSNTPFREYKHFVHEGGISTPLIAHWPKGIKRHGELERQPGHLIDIAATCVAVSGAEYPVDILTARPGVEPDKPFGTLIDITPLEGVSLAPAFSGKSLDRPQPIFWEHEGNRAIRDGKWKLVAKENRPWELYDMSKDRTEMHDLADKMPDLVKQLDETWTAWAKRANVLPLGMWRGPKKNAAYNKKQKDFSFKPGADISREAGPFVQGRAIQIQANLKSTGDGVIVAQGGEADGYSLYIKDGRLTFTSRIRSKVTTVASQEKVAAGEAIIELTLAKNGDVTIEGAGVKATGATPGPMAVQPIDGLQVGSDTGGPVGLYKAPFEFQGELNFVQVHVK